MTTTFILQIILSTLSFASPLSLESYLAQVEERNPAHLAAQKSAEGFSLRKYEGNLASLPYAFFSFTQLDDQKPTATPTFSGTRNRTSQYSAGIGANTSIGLQAKYTFNLTHTELQNATMIPQPNYFTALNQVEFTQSLLRNSFGSEISAQTSIANNANLAQHYAEKFKISLQTTEAENAYWRLAVARKAVTIQRDLLSRAEKLLEWAKRRVSFQLGDKADELQARANVELRKIDLRLLEEEEKSAARAFNLLRHMEISEVQEAIPLPETKFLLDQKFPIKEGIRYDVRAAEHQEKSSRAGSQLDKEKVKPKLDLFASLAWNGRNGLRNPALDQSYSSEKPTTTFGLVFTTPLAFGTIQNTFHGTSLSQEAAALLLEKKLIDEKEEWEELKSRALDAYSRLSLLESLESVQKEKFENERQRLLKGRTTTYQMLTFEQDYAQTQLAKIRTQAELLRLRAQAKIFRGEL